MTARDFLDIRLRRTRKTFYSGLAVAVGAFALQAVIITAGPGAGRTRDWALFIFMGGVLAGGAIAAVGDRYGRSTVRCPWCGDGLYSLAYHGGFSIGHAKFCLYCGKSLDDELPVGGKHGKSTAKPTPREDELA